MNFDFQARADAITNAANISPVRVTLVLDQSQFWSHPRKGHLLGQANYREREVRILDGREFEAVLETLHHEMAHFLAFQHGDYKHGRYFKHYARKLGAFARARVGTVPQEKARSARLASAKSARAKNRKEHPSHTDWVDDCHLCERDLGFLR